MLAFKRSCLSFGRCKALFQYYLAKEIDYLAKEIDYSGNIINFPGKKIVLEKFLESTSKPSTTDQKLFSLV